MSESQLPPSAQDVACEFVKQYYTVLNAAPDFLHRFYSHNSSFIHGDDQSAATGQTEIHKKIMSLNFINCHAKICQVDSQCSVADSIVVQVIGELSNAGQPMRRFVQSFVLAPQTAKKYYVHVDILRFQDDLVLSSNQEVEENLEEIGENEEIDGSGVTKAAHVPVVELVSSDVETLKSHDTADGSHDTAAVASFDVTTDMSDDKHVEGDVVVCDAAAETQNAEETLQPSASVDAQPDETELDKVTEPPPTEPVAKPLTWAALASRNTGGPSQPVGSILSTVTRPPVSEQKSERQTSPTFSAKPTPTSDERVNRFNGRIVNGVTDNDKRALNNAQVVYCDNHQVFVGNLPQHLTDQELTDFFEQFGTVLDLKINRKPGGQGGNNVGQKNFGFMTFENPETVEKVLAARPIFMGKHRLNIEEKKPKQELPTPRSRGARFPTARSGRQNVEYGNGVGRTGPRRSDIEFRNDTRSPFSDEG